MALYDYDNEIVAEQLTPPALRESKFLSWLYVITKPIQNLWSLIFEDYKIGSSYPEFDILVTYNFGDRVFYTDKAIYECTALNPDGTAGGVLGIAPVSTYAYAYWTKVNNDFIGVDERIKYNSQLIVLEYALNKWFLNLSATDQIYVNTNAITSNIFLMGETGTYSSTMANSSPFSLYFMPEDATFPTQYNFTINVPAALFTTLGTNSTNRENTVRAFADKYVLSGITYNVTTY
jgi:hypothetical protein